MRKKILTEQALYYGDVSMPKGFEIDSLELVQSINKSLYLQKDFIFSKSWDMLNKYVIEYAKLNFKINLINKDSWGNIYIPSEKTEPLLNINPVDYKNSPDFVLLYGINTKDCNVRIYYDDNRRKGRSFDIELKNNMFIMFPSTNMYYINNKQTESLNFIQTITYEFV